MSNMYDNAVTWNPFKGCEFDCSYCKPSFQAQAKRQRKNCEYCYTYEPHYHAERMTRIPKKADIVFACGNSDVHFCERPYMEWMLEEVAKRPEQTLYFQSKAPEVFAQCDIPSNVILVTTLETNRDKGYREAVSKRAPLPTERYAQFAKLEHPRKVVTIEPIMDFDEGPFFDMLCAIKPEYVWIGYNSRPKSVKLPEPSLDKTWSLVSNLGAADIKVKLKHIPKEGEER